MTAQADDRRGSDGAPLPRYVRMSGIVLAAWFGFTVLELSVSAALAKPGEVKWGREILIDVTMALYWSAVTLPIATLHRWLRARGTGLAAMVAFHLPLLVLVILGDTYSSRLAVELVAGVTPAASAIGTITYFADFDTLSYLAVVIVTDALLARRAMHAEERRSSHLESLLARARLDYLEAQLQPHFLFNALGAVSELAYEAPATAVRVLRQLARIFRTALGSRAGEVTLGKELAAIEPYLEIQRLRFPDWLRIDYDVAGDTLDCLVPRFVLQPLIENAIRHGLTGRVAAGCIEISSRVTAGRLLLRVADNGVGLRQLVMRPGYGIGLTNVRERLATLYGSGEQLRLVDAVGGGAVAEVDLPIRRLDEVPAEATGLTLESVEEAPGTGSDPAAHHDEDGISATARRVRTLVLWLICGVLWTVQSYAYLSIRNRLGESSFLSLALHDVAAALLWGAIAQLVFAVTSRFPLRREHLARRVAVYGPGMVAIALVHAAVLERLLTTRISFWSPLNTNTFILNFLIVAVLVGFGHRRQLSEWRRERENAARKLSAELRAARARAARLQEIPPVVLAALERAIEAVGTVPSPRRTEQLLARLGDYLRVAIECSDEHGITPSREQSLVRSLAQFERVAQTTSATTSSLSSP